MQEYIQSYSKESLFLVFLITFITTYLIIPLIIKVVNHKQLLDQPNHRSSHTQLTPTFGGISFYLSLIMVLLFINSLQESLVTINIVAGLSILLFIGLKDDMVVISYKAKLIGQFLASIVFLYNSTFYQINFHGFLGIESIGVISGTILSILILLTIINAFNLIDGVDGLAGSTGISVFSIFGILFYITGHIYYTFICITLVGSLLAFLRFNFSSKKKIFMGDTGSLILGFIAGVLTLKFLGLKTETLVDINFIPRNGFFVVLAILIFPLFDLFRILMVRISNRKHPLLADKNHIHHVLLDHGNSHLKTSLLISSFSLIFSILMIYLTTIIDNTLILSFIIIILYFIFLAFFFKLATSNLATSDKK